MSSVIVDISSYTILIFFAIYTLFGLMGLLVSNPKRQNSLLKKQRVFLFAVHFNCYIAIIAYSPLTEIAVLYVIEVVFFFFLMKIYSYFYEDGNVLLLNNMLMCMAVGFIMITRLDFDLAIKQVIIAAVTSVILLVIPGYSSKFKYIEKGTWIYAGLGFISLLIVFLIGTISGGAKLSVSIFGYSFQPSEFVKILFVFFVAGILSKSTDLVHVIIATAVAAAHVLLLVMSTDLGAALIFFVTYLAMLFVATKSWIWLTLGLGSGALASVIAYKMFYHIQVRITAWLDPLSTIENEGYQISQAMFAIGAGGWFGEGLGKGMPYKIPVVEKDFIFAAITEEFGVLFAICLVLVALTNFLMMLNISMQIKDKNIRLIALGLGVTYGFQMFLNIGGVTRFIPSTGVTLPLISYGGTSMVANLVVFTLIQGFYVLNNEEKKAKANARKKRNN